MFGLTELEVTGDDEACDEDDDDDECNVTTGLASEHVDDSDSEAQAVRKYEPKQLVCHYVLTYLLSLGFCCSFWKIG